MPLGATSDVTAATCSSFPLPTYLPTLSARDDHQYAPTYLSRSSDHRQRVGLPWEGAEDQMPRHHRVGAADQFCNHGPGTHGSLLGRTPGGLFKTGAAQEYPPTLCKYIAFLYLSRY